ncbi:MAG TPA: primosomal protein N' [Deltaproteobacteria bacterium]|nr:primosomal protein N' [Deltaproteobacteria bacterium]
MEKTLADVVVLSGVPIRLTYETDVSRKLCAGSRVVVPLRTGTRVGVVVSVYSGCKEGLKKIHSVIDEHPLITEELIDLLQWCSRYYHAGIGSTIALAFPPYLRQAKTISLVNDEVLIRSASGTGRVGRKQHAIMEAIPEQGISAERLSKMFPGSRASISSLIEKGHVQSVKKPASAEGAPLPEAGIIYTDEQKHAISEIEAALDSNEFRSFILHGITGSGKTEVYLACATKALKMGRSVLYLVPEISLTPQSIAMIQKRIPQEIAVFHSGLSPRARAVEFMKASLGKTRFVLGTRSAVFAPLTNPGLIIVDEEHDHSYKQEDGVPYNARDLSILRARNNRAVVILGSATPSMDTFIRAGSKSAQLLTMAKRTGSATLPEIEIVDMKGVKGHFSEKLLSAVEQTVSRKEQALLFINRRGFSPAMVCPGCARVLTCEHCARSLTYHKAKGVALCHYCGFSIRLPEICPSCGCLDMKPVGLGTEQIVQSVQHHFPDMRVLKMDSDEITNGKRLDSALSAIRNRETDIIVGTQMIAKGHDFPHLTLVGVMHAEQLMFMPDFRAGERTFQQIVQVAGRAGRRISDTKVLIQTLIPDHPLICSIAAYDYQGMLANEETIRRASGFPPFMYLIRCVFTSRSSDEVKTAIHQAAHKISRFDVDILGPAPAPLSMIRNSHRWHMLVRSPNRTQLHRAVEALEGMRISSQVTVRIDVDPYTML